MIARRKYKKATEMYLNAHEDCDLYGTTTLAWIQHE
jgi:hypothetical protein